VGELEAMVVANDDYMNLGIPMGADLVKIWNHEIGDRYEEIERVYWSVNKIIIRGVLDGIRTTLTELVAELRAGMPDDADTPSSELAAQAVAVAVHGKGHRVSVVTAQSGAPGTSQAVQQGRARAG
jgi:hypothetical protein